MPFMWSGISRNSKLLHAVRRSAFRSQHGALKAPIFTMQTRPLSASVRTYFCVVFWVAALGPSRVLSQPLSASKPVPVPTVDAGQYRATLESAQSKLKQMESGRAPRKDLEALLQTLSKPERVRVRRSDGATQIVGNDQWARIGLNLDDAPPGRGVKAPRADVTQARRAADERLRALDDWMQPRDGSFYQAAQAQKIVRDLESTSQIRTGPTVVQQWWASFKAAFNRFIERLGRAIFGVGKRVAPTRVAHIDNRWVMFLFYSTVFSLLGVVGWLLWRHLGGRLGRDGARRDVRFVGGEDAELLVLPQGELRTRAQRFADEGNFREAVRHRFIALLLHLDDRAVWRYDARRTNWEHIGALRRRMSTHANAQAAPLAMIEPLSNLTRRFDRVRYGDAPTSLDEWNIFDRDAAVLEELANRPASSAAPLTTPTATATNATANAPTGARP